MNSRLERDTVAALDAGGRLLVSRLQYLGDVVLSLSLLDAIRERFPRAEVDYLTRDEGAAILAGERVVDRVFRVPTSGGGWRELAAVIAAMRRRRYAAAIDLYSNPRSALLCWLSGARMRIGGNRRGRRHFYTHPTTVTPSVRSAIEHHLAFARSLDVNLPPRKPCLHPNEEERRHAREALDVLGIDPHRPVVGLHPGGKWEVKRWPAERFAELGRRLVARHVQVIVFAGPGEAQFQNAVHGLLGDGALYSPVFALREMAAVLSMLDAMVVCDGGIMHVSVAVGTPTVGLFGSSEPDIWFPYESFGPYLPAWIPIDCRPCHMHECGHLSCLRGLDIDRVEAVLDTVSSRARTGVGPQAGGRWSR